MRIDEIKVSKAIMTTFQKKFLDFLDVDAAIVGGGPAGMVCGYYLAKAGKRVALFERKLSVGGGMWGGGMMFNEIVVQHQAKAVLDELGIRTKLFEKNCYTADAVECVSGICFKAVQAGLKIFNLMSVEDVMARNKKITGLVLNWTAVEMANLHVDPLTMRAKHVVDATGHAAEVVRIVERKSGIRLKTKTGKMIGEGLMCAHEGELATLCNSKEICDGLSVCGMCANAVFGGPRMGPIFGGMLLSGRKIAQELIKKI